MEEESFFECQITATIAEFEIDLFPRLNLYSPFVNGVQNRLITWIMT